jgi:hypothetical protein
MIIDAVPYICPRPSVATAATAVCHSGRSRPLAIIWIHPWRTANISTSGTTAPASLIVTTSAHSPNHPSVDSDFERQIGRSCGHSLLFALGYASSALQRLLSLLVQLINPRCIPCSPNLVLFAPSCGEYPGVATLRVAW